jgi:hypothetical protein
MGRIAGHLISAILFCTALSSTGAQESYVKEGATIRFQTDSGHYTHTGQLAVLTIDSLFLQRCATCFRLTYSRTEVSHLAVLRPEARGDRFLAGLLIGALAGGGLGYIAASTCGGGEKCDLAGLAIPFGAIVGGLFGGVAGVLSAYRWQPVGPDGR